MYPLRSTEHLVALFTVSVMAACVAPADPCECDPDSVAADATPDDGSAEPEVVSVGDVGAGHGDVGGRLPSPDCSAQPMQVYQTPGGLPPYSAAQAGKIVRCAYDGTLPAVQLAAAAKSVGHGALSFPGPVRSHRIAYRTERLDGVGAIGSAEVWVPLVGRRTEGFVVVTHGTTGLADVCAPSLTHWWSDYLVLPALARGWVVIAPDYAGLGTDGVQGYFNTRDTAHSVLDAARALDALVPEVSGKPFVVLGHSQGGGSALSAQALSESYGPAGRMRGAIAFAPGHTVTDRSNWVHIPELEAGGNAAFFALVLYADFAWLLGPEQAGYAFAPKIRGEFEDIIGHLCYDQMVDAMAGLAPTLGDILDDGFEAKVKACLLQNKCPPPIDGWVQRNKAAVVPPDPKGAPALILAGDKDAGATTVNIACFAKFLTQGKLPPTVCRYADADHGSVVRKAMPHALAWLEARLVGSAPPTCGDPKLPECPWW